MIIKTNVFSIKSTRREQFISITEDVNELVRRSGVISGSAKLFIPHTTAGITIAHNSDPDAIKDIHTLLSNTIPHQHLLKAEGNSDSHVKSTIFGVSLDVPIAKRKLALGEWQGIFFCEFDGPRTRKVQVHIWGIQ